MISRALLLGGVVAANSTLPDTISNIALPGGIASMFAVVLVTLIRSRSTDRSQLSTEQKEHMDRLTTERDTAEARASQAETDLDHERALRRAAELDAATANLAALRLTEQIRRMAVGPTNPPATP